MALNQLQTGVQNNSDGVIIQARAGKQGDQIVSELHGRYYEQAYRGNLFKAATAGITTAAGLPVANTSLVTSGLYNPAGSGVNLVVEKHGAQYLVAFAAASALGVQTGYSSIAASAYTAATYSKNANGATYSGRAVPFNAITFPTGTVFTAQAVDTYIGAGLTGAITTVPVDNIFVDMEGSIVVPPGGYVAAYVSTVAGASAGYYSWMWEETPV